MANIFIIPKKALITIDVFYYLPDYPLLIEEFMWQVEDIIPEIKRVKKFILFWERNIDADIQEIMLAGLDSPDSRQRFNSVDEILSL